MQEVSGGVLLTKKEAAIALWYISVYRAIGPNGLKLRGELLTIKNLPSPYGQHVKE